MPLPKAILMDLDDTLIAFDAVTARCWQTVCEAFVRQESAAFDAVKLQDTLAQVSRAYWSDPERHRAGRANLPATRRLLVRQAFQSLGIADGEKADRLADDYTALQKASQHLLDGVPEALQIISGLGIRLAAVTNGTSSEQREKLSRFCLMPFFEAVFIEEERGFGKPDLRVYQTALDALKLQAKDVWMIGDNLIWDVGAPQKLGIYSVWNDYRQTGLPQGSDILPDMIVPSVYALSRLLAEYENK